MPELPEVEGFRRRLAPLITGRPIARLEVLDAKLWRPAEGLAAPAAAGRSVQALDRRAKLLLFRLDGGLTLVLHLKIAGQLVFAPPDAPRLVGGHPYPLPDADLPAAATRFVLHFGAPGTLYVNDQRRFAWLRLLPDEDAAAFVAEQRYGPDPLAPGFTADALAARLAARARRPLKAALLDQTCIAGLGNIYADESLHAARLHPMVRTGDLTRAEIAGLHRAILDVLELAVPVGGALVKVGKAVDEPGAGRNFLRAHGRAGEPCPDCGRAGRPGPDGAPPLIVRQFLAARGTYYCPVCQPAPPGFDAAAVALAAPQGAARGDAADD
jgi:formamidopyrimidine-DNA glycosylase